MSKYVKWHARIVWTGIILNMLFVIPLIFAPAWIIGLLQIPVPDQLIWPRFAGILLLIVSVFYIPAAIDVKRYRANAWIAIVPSRSFGAIFFFLAVFVFDQAAGFIAGVILDGSIGIVTFILLMHISREERKLNDPVSFF